MGQTKTANTKSAVLAFYPHPKAIGYAVMNSPTQIRGSNYRYISAKKVEAYIEHVTSIILLYKPTLIVLEQEQSRNQYRGKHMQYVFKEIEKLIVRLNYPLVHYSRRNITDTFAGLNKPEIADAIAEAHPYYLERLPKKRVSTDGAESPAMSEFDALSLVYTHFANYH